MRYHPHALYADTTSRTVWEIIPHPMLDGILLLNDKKVILHTSAADTAWTSLLSEQEAAANDNKILKISWKTSTMGGGI